MSFAAATGAPVVATDANGLQQEFRKLTRAEIGALIARWAAEDRHRLKTTLAESNASPELRVAQLTEFDERAAMFGFGLVRLNEFPKRTLESLCLSRNETPEQAEAWAFTREELIEIVYATWGENYGYYKRLAEEPEKKTPA